MTIISIIARITQIGTLEKISYFQTFFLKKGEEKIWEKVVKGGIKRFAFLFQQKHFFSIFFRQCLRKLWLRHELIIFWENGVFFLGKNREKISQIWISWKEKKEGIFCLSSTLADNHSSLSMYRVSQNIFPS